MSNHHRGLPKPPGAAFRTAIETPGADLVEPLARAFWADRDVARIVLCYCVDVARHVENRARVGRWIAGGIGLAIGIAVTSSIAAALAWWLA